MRTYLAGGAMTKFKELWGNDLRDLALEAANGALKSAKKKISEIDAIFVGNMAAETLTGQAHLGSLISGSLNSNLPSYRVEAACASGGMAINLASMAIAGGKYKNILVIGVEKMTDVSAGQAALSLAAAADEEEEAFYGASFPSLYAMIARAYMQEYGLTREQLAEVPVKNHFHGSFNEFAHFQNQISLDQVVSASEIASPLGLLDCSPISDGAAAVVLTAEKTEIELVASELATDNISLHNRKSLTSLGAARIAGNRAYKQAGITSKDIDIAEVHDCFSIAEIVAYEDLGFAKPGKGSEIVKSAYIDGSLPVNVSGGLKACGHPVGATGVKQLLELYWQLKGIAGKRQVKNRLAYGLAHNVGGTGGTAVVNILKSNNA